MQITMSIFLYRSASRFVSAAPKRLLLLVVDSYRRREES